MNRFAALLAGLALFSGTVMAGEQGLMHCFAFTPIAEATQADWDAFGKATDALPKNIKGLKRVWHGKLLRPLTLPALAISDPAKRKELMAAGKGNADVNIMRREHGVCMEFADEAAFAAYGKDTAHADWVKAYEKVRIAGTTTYQIVAK